MSEKSVNVSGNREKVKTTEKKKSAATQKEKSSSTKKKVEKKDIKTEEKLKKIDNLTQEVKEWHDKYLRLSAEFDNYRKRTLREKADLLRLANEDLLKDLLTVVDDFERGIVTIDKSEDLEALKSGIHLIYNKFIDFIKQKGLTEIKALKEPFDIDYHEAVTKIPAPSKELKGKVVDVLEKGYILNDKVVRYAKVVVGE
ncbi:MAG: nucleotide exchange factor GrpE [Bacteroidales bacterium]|jgi:molecular chaperone GrpE|nr:nucleotide exchange factor GrpE [Bacteroidales bacterium]